MDIISKYEWEYIKQQPSFWNKYSQSIHIDDRDLAILDLGDRVVLPKFFIQHNYEELKVHQIGHDIINRVNNSPIKYAQTSIKVKFDPRPEQQIVFDTFLNIFQKEGHINGILQARPGVGKTFMSIKLSSILGYKTLCVVPNSILEDQWIGEIMNFTGLSKDKIGVIQGSDINKIKKNKILDCDIMVVKIQTLLSQLKRIDLTELEEFYASIGLVFYDECHQSGSAESYAKTAFLFKTNNIIGLSATPFTKGINEFLMLNSMGEVLIDLDHQNLIPTITLHNIYVDFTPDEIRRLNFAKTDYVRFLATHNMILEKKDAYLNHIADWVEYRHKTNHITAVLFATNKMVFKMEKILKSRGYDIGVITGSTNKKLESIKEYLTIEQVQVFYDNYFKVFPKRKKCPTLKPFKNDATKYSLTKPILKDLNKMKDTFPDLKLEVHKTEVNTMTERDIMGSKDIVVSNFKMLTTGYSRSELTNILVCTPLVGAIPSIQVTGRITRACKEKNQDIQAQFFFTNIYLKYFPNMHFTLVNNLKKSYSEAKFKYEGFEGLKGFNFEKKEKSVATVAAAPAQYKN